MSDLIAGNGGFLFQIKSRSVKRNDPKKKRTLKWNANVKFITQKRKYLLKGFVLFTRLVSQLSRFWWKISTKNIENNHKLMEMKNPRSKNKLKFKLKTQILDLIETGVEYYEIFQSFCISKSTLVIKLQVCLNQ